MSESQLRKLCSLSVPVPVRAGSRFYLCGPGAMVEFPAAEIDTGNRLHKARVRAYLVKQARVALGVCPGESVVGVLEDVNPRLFAAWWR